jgi:hypothetical protein
MMRGWRDKPQIKKIVAAAIFLPMWIVCPVAWSLLYVLVAEEEVPKIVERGPKITGGERKRGRR